MRRRYHGRNALIKRWNKYHPINREVARHIAALEQQGERISGRWIPQAQLDVLALCEWAIREGHDIVEQIIVVNSARSAKQPHPPAWANNIDRSRQFTFSIARDVERRAF